MERDGSGSDLASSRRLEIALKVWMPKNCVAVSGDTKQVGQFSPGFCVFFMIELVYRMTLAVLAFFARCAWTILLCCVVICYSMPM